MPPPWNESRTTSAQRYFELVRTMPAPPFTFETRKGIHRHLFGDVYDWAGEPRTIGIRKAEWDAPNSQMTTFTDPTKIPGMARVIFNAIGQGRTLMDLDREIFAARAAELLNDLNIVHPFRDGNGRSQRLLLAAIGEAAGHPIAFEVATRERMVATSIAAAQGDLGGFTRLLEEATDPRRTQAMNTALGFLRKSFPAWNDTYIATTTAGQSYNGVLVGPTKTDFMMRVGAQPTDWIAVGDAADLPHGAVSGQSITLTASPLGAGPTASSHPEGPEPGPRRTSPSPGM